MLPELIAELKQLQESGLTRNLVASVRVDATTVIVRGRSVMDFTSFDYLGLSQRASIVKAVVQEIEKSGCGSFAARTTVGGNEMHFTCEQRLGQFFNYPAALLFSPRNQAIWSLLTSILNESDLLWIDEQSDSPALDVAALVGTQLISSACNGAQIELEFAKATSGRRRIIFIEALSAYTGQVAALREIMTAARRVGAQVIIDESAAIAAFGLRGAGIQDALSSADLEIIAGMPLATICDLGSVLGGSLACVASARELYNLIVARSATINREVAPPSYMIAGLLPAIEEIELMHEARARLKLKVLEFREALAQLKLIDRGSLDSPIIVMRFGKLKSARLFAEALFERGILAEVLSSRVVRNDHGAVRFVVCQAHSDVQLKGALQVIDDLVTRLKLVG